MKLEEALQDSGLAEAWFDGYVAVVVRENDGYNLSIEQQGKSPHLTRNGISLAQVENEVKMFRDGHPTEWSPVDLEG